MERGAAVAGLGLLDGLAIAADTHRIEYRKRFVEYVPLAWDAQRRRTEERLSSKVSSQSGGTSVAFDLGANAVRVVEVEWSGSDGGGRLVKRGTAPLPVNVWNDLPANSGAFVAAIRQALSSAGIGAKAVSAALPRRLVTLRFARLPHAPPEQMRGLVAFEAQQYVLFPLDEVILDYHVVTDRSTGLALPAEDDMESVLLAAARRSLIIDLIAIFEKAGLELEQLTVSALALAEHIRDSIEPTAVIDVEPGEMDVAVVANRQLLFTRASGLDVTGAQPEIAARRLADEIARSFTSFQNEYRQQVLTHINLTGPSVQGAEGMAVEQTLGSVLEMHIGRLSSRLLPPTDTDANGYATAVGVALQTRAGSLASINLVPDERAIKKAQLAQRRQKQFAVATAVLTAALLAFFVQQYVVASAKERSVQLAANDKLRQYNDALAARKKRFQTRKALYDELTAGLDRSQPAIDVLVALNRALPQTTEIWLTQFAFDRNGLITLHGETKSANAATDMVIALQASGAFLDVKVAYLGDAQENDLVSGDAAASAPAPAAPANPVPATPLAGMAPAALSRPGAGGAPTAPPPPRSPALPAGSSGAVPTTTSFPPGQGFPNGLPPGVVFPQGQIPAEMRAKLMEMNARRQAVPNEAQAIPAPVAPPPFYLIGYGQDPATTQQATAADTNAKPDDGTGAGRGKGRKRRQSRLGQDPSFAIQGVTPNGAGSSNQIPPGSRPVSQESRGSTGASQAPKLPQGGPVINPAAPKAPTATTPKPVPARPLPAASPTRPRATLTSFIITCRLNPQAHTLLATPASAPARGAKHAQPTVSGSSRRPIGAENDTTEPTDTGGETDGSP